MSVAAGTVQFSSTASSYASLVVQSGTVQLGASNALPTGVSIDLGSAAAANLDLAGFQQTILGVSQDSFAATIGNSSITADSTLTTTGTSSFAGVIQDTLGGGTHEVHVAVTSGQFTLSGANTYTGGTTISGGTLTAASATALGGATSPLVLNGGTLDLATDASIAAYNTTVAGNVEIRAERATAGAGVTQSLGTLNIGGQTLTVDTTTLATSGTETLAFGSVNMTGTPTLLVNSGSTAAVALSPGAHRRRWQRTYQRRIRRASSAHGGRHLFRRHDDRRRARSYWATRRRSALAG